MARIILIPLALLLVLIIAAAVLVPLLLDKDKILELASKAVHEQTGATLTVDGDASISVFPTLGLSLGDAAITMPEKQEPDLRLGSLEIGVQLMPLFSGEVAIDTLAVDGLAISMESAQKESKVDTSKLSDAELDAYYAQREKDQAKAENAAGAEAALAVPLALKVSSLRVTDSRVKMIDPETQAATVIELISLRASNLNLDGTAIPLEINLRIPGEQPIAVSASGKISVDQNSQTANLQGIDVRVEGATAATLNLQTSGIVDLQRQVADLQLTLELAETRGKGTLRYANFESPQIDANLDLNLLDPALLVLAGPEAAEKAQESPTAGGDDPLPLDAIRGIDTRAQLRIEEARFGAHSIHNMQAKLRALNGVIKIRDVAGTLHGGALKAGATFNGKHNTATLDTTGSLSKLDIATALAATGTTATITGTATLNWQLNSRGRTSNELIEALAGPIQLGTEEIVLQGTSVEKMLCQVVALTNQEQLTATFEPATRFTTLSADIQVADGKASLRPLRAELANVSLTGGGNFNLLSQDFDTTFKARLSPGLEEVDRACRVSKRITAIDWPVNCKGNTATEPGGWCKVDSDKIIQDLAVSEGKRKLEKEASKLLNKLFKK